MNFLIIIFSILFFLLAWRRLDLAAMFLIASLPSYLIRFTIFGIPSTILEMMIWVIFLIWFIKNYKWIFEKVKLRIANNELRIINRYPFDLELILLLLIALAAAGITGFSNSSLGIWKAYFFEPVLFFIVVFNVLRGQQGREKIFWSLIVSALAVSALAVYQKISGQLIANPLWAAAETRRVVSFFGYPNAVGLYLGPLVLIFLGWLCSVIKNDQFSILNFQKIFNIRIFKPIFITFVIIASVLSIYFAKSKGALLGLTIGLAIFGLMAHKKVRWATVIICILIGVGITAYQPARRLAVENITFTNKSGQIRQVGWSDTWKMLADGRLVTGAGLANFQAAVAPYHTEGVFIKDPDDPDAQRKLVFNEAYRTAHWQPLEIYLYPHNIILNFWSELGLAGLLLFTWLIMKYFKMGIYNLQFASRPNLGVKATGNKFLNLGLICAMAAIIIHGIVDVPYFKNDLAVIFWLLVAMIGQINLESKNG